MKTTTAPDTRPAIAFDRADEVRLLTDALIDFRHQNPNHMHIKMINKLEDILDEVEGMFFKQ